MKPSRKWVTFILAMVMVTAFTLTGCNGSNGQTEDNKELVIFTWAEYIPEDVIKAFEEQSGYKVVYSTFESNEEMLTKLSAAKGGDYDLVLVGDYVIDMARKQGLVQKLDKTKIPRFKDIDPGAQGFFFDPDNEYVVPYVAGTPLIVYDPAKVDIDIKGYNDLWDPSLKDSVVVFDDARLMVGFTMKAMGYSLNTTDPETIKAAGDKLIELKPNIKALDYNTPHEKMISGEATVGFMFTSQLFDVMAAKPDFKLVYPEEGMGFGIDGFFIPAKAPNPTAANEFLNYILDGKTSAELTRFTKYMNCVTTAKEFMTEEEMNNPAVYIPKDKLGDTEFIEDVGTAAEIIDEEWTRFKQS